MVRILDSPKYKVDTIKKLFSQRVNRPAEGVPVVPKAMGLKEIGQFSAFELLERVSLVDRSTRINSYKSWGGTNPVDEKDNRLYQKKPLSMPRSIRAAFARRGVSASG